MQRKGEGVNHIFLFSPDVVRIQAHNLQGPIVGIVCIAFLSITIFRITVFESRTFYVRFLLFYTRHQAAMTNGGDNVNDDGADAEEGMTAVTQVLKDAVKRTSKSFKRRLSRKESKIIFQPGKSAINPPSKSELAVSKQQTALTREDWFASDQNPERPVERTQPQVSPSAPPLGQGLEEILPSGKRAGGAHRPTRRRSLQPPQR